MADNNNKTNKNEGNKEHVLLSTSLSFKINDGLDHDNNNNNIKCSSFSNSLVQEQKSFLLNPVNKLEKNENAPLADSALLLGELPATRFGFLNSYQRTVDYSAIDATSSSIHDQQYKPSYTSYENDFNNNGLTWSQNGADWSQNGHTNFNNTGFQSYSNHANQQIVNYSDFAPSQAYSASTSSTIGTSFNSSSVLLASQNTCQSSLNVNIDSNGAQNSKNFTYRPSTNDGLFNQSNIYSKTALIGSFKKEFFTLKN